MTGFGAASTQADGVHYAVEVRSLNSKYFKAQIRVPDELQGVEAELEARLAAKLSRGTVVATVRTAENAALGPSSIDHVVAQGYLNDLLGLKGADDPRVRIDLTALLTLPGVLINESPVERLERVRSTLLNLVDEACDSLIEMRVREGGTLREDLRRHCGSVASHIEVVTERMPQLVSLYQDKLKVRMDALLADSAAVAREEDVLREVAIFAERSDVAEEVDRLRGHLGQFSEILERDDSEPRGRTLDFITQEMLREANTIGSKCLDVEVSRRIVEIKGAIDRIKEQVQNVE